MEISKGVQKMVSNTDEFIKDLRKEMYDHMCEKTPDITVGEAEEILNWFTNYLKSKVKG